MGRMHALDGTVDGLVSDFLLGREQSERRIAQWAATATAAARSELGRRLASDLREADEKGSGALIRALAVIRWPRTVRSVAAYADSQSADVRLAVARALFDVVGRGRRGIPLLLRLSADESPDVRNWASTGLRISVEIFGHRDADILDALATRLQDPDDEVRGEAILGLAVAGDSRARVALMGAPADRVGDLYLDHARHYLEDPDF